MIEMFAWSVTNFFAKRKVILKEDDEIYAFGFECMIADLIQYIILFSAGLLFNNLVPLAIISIGFVAERKHIGGYHANSHFQCILLASLSLIGGSLICVFIPFWAIGILLSVTWIIIYMLAPVQHVNNPKTEEEIKTNRKLSLRNTAVITLACILFLPGPFKNWAVYLSLGSLLAAFTLLIPCKSL